MEKIVFANGQAPALNDTNLNQLQTNIENAIDLKANTSSLADVATTGNYNDLTNKPTIPTNSSFTLNGLSEKNYNNLTNKPTIPTNSSFTLNGLSEKSYDNLTSKPKINNVTLSGNKTTSDLGLFSGSYADLTNKPTIPSKTSDLTNDSDFIDKDVNNLTNYTKTSELYEKGTWTPYLYTLEPTQQKASSCTYSTQYGNYFRIGKLVYIEFYIKGRITELVGLTNTGIVVGLPFEVVNNSITYNAYLPLVVGEDKFSHSDWENGTELYVQRTTASVYTYKTFIAMKKKPQGMATLYVSDNDLILTGSGWYIIDDTI